MSNTLSKLSERDQKAAMMRASGCSLKEISNETGLGYDRVREVFAPHDKQRNQVLIDAVAEIKDGLALGLKSLPDLIVNRLRAEISNGNSETSHHYIKLAQTMVRDLDESTKSASKGLPGIQALIQNFVTEKPAKNNGYNDTHILPAVVKVESDA